MEEKDFDLLERYVRGLLTEEERLSVEKQLREDKAYSELCEQYKFLIGGIRAVGREELLSKLRDIERQQPTEIKDTLNIKLVTWLAAAVVVVAIGVFWLLNSKPDAKLLAREAFEPYPNVVLPTVRSTHADSGKLATVYRLYDQEKYEEAITGFVALQDKRQSEWFYLGICYMITENHNRATEAFRKAQSVSGDFTNQTEWYLALSYFAAGNVDEGRRLLGTISTRNNTYSVKARALLDKL